LLRTAIAGDEAREHRLQLRIVEFLRALQQRAHLFPAGPLQRPVCTEGGGHLVDMMNWANDFDVYTEWARAVCHGEFTAVPARKYHVGMVFKRALGEGRITGIVGREMFHHAAGEWLVADALLPIGAHRRDWKATLVSDGFLAVRHPDLGKVHALMDRAINEVRLYAGG
jgi:hypothetical protein